MLKNFFLIYSGVDKNLINECSNGEQNKYILIGVTFFYSNWQQAKMKIDEKNNI
ncbi:hypothetical protein [Polaribacter sp. Asnod1-A03]|uniref:hypothetical protein n=1 Tax=Polaribacter sp. Asnod1-A03 TaxID=3160581 RepID=UPI00386D66EE